MNTRVFLFLHVMSMEFRKIVSYRADFWVTYVGQVLAHFLVATALWKNIFESNNLTQMQGYTMNDMAFYYLITPLILKIMMGENIGFISREIYEGTLNRYLVYPISFFSYKMTTYLTHSLTYLLQAFVVFSLWILYFNIPWHTTYIYSFILLFFSAITYGLFLGLMELVSFWTDNTWSLGVMVRFTVLFLGGAFVPLAFFPEMMNRALIYFPFHSMIHLPTQLLMNRAGFSEFIQGLLVIWVWILFLCVMIRVVWKKGSLQYTGVGM